MRATSWCWLALVALCFVAGCESCLGLDDYELVPADFPIPSGGFGPIVGGGGSSPMGGFGGVPAECDEPPSGTVFVALPVAAGESQALVCQAPASPNGGLEVMALDALDGGCGAHERIAAQAGATLAAGVRITHGSDARVQVAARYQGGDLLLPDDCQSSNTVTVLAEPGATDARFVASLRRVGTSICTDWVRRGWTFDPGALALHDLSHSADRVVLVGNLGGAELFIEDGNATTALQGAAFALVFDGSGNLSASDAYGSSADDALHGATIIDDGVLLTGSLRDEDPACHGCNGVSHVVDAAGNCDGAGGTSGLPDSQNAWLWSRLSGDASCARFDTFGSDRDGADGAQIGYASAARSANGCTTYWTGIAGSDTWRWSSAAPETTLYDPDAPTVDGFLFTTQGATCGVGSTYVSSVRMVPSLGGFAAWGNRIEALACQPGSLSTSFVSGAATSLKMARCDQRGNCVTNADLPLPGAAQQLVVANLDDGGAPRWHGAIGPVDVSLTTIANAGIGGTQRDNLASDRGDHSHIVFTTTGPMQLQNIDAAACPAIAQGVSAGSFVVALEADGSADRAVCRWAARLGP